MTLQKVKFTVEYTSWIDNSKSVISTVIDFEDREDIIYYGYHFRDNNDQFICHRTQSIYKKVIDTDNTLEFAINHATYSIDHYRIGRRKIFKVIDAAPC